MDTDDVKDYVNNAFRPSYIVFASEESKKICKLNNLSPAEMLRPFSNTMNEQLIFKPPEKSPAYVLNNFRLEAYDVADYEPLSAAECVNLRKKAVDSNPPTFDFSTLQSDVDILELKSMRCRWFEDWRSTYLELGRVQQFEYIQQPFAWVVMVSVEESIQDALHAVLSKKPSILEKHFDQDIPKILLILVPNNAESLKKAGSVLESAKKTIAAFQIYLVPINSLYYSKETLNDDIWIPYLKTYKREGEFENLTPREHGMYLAQSERVKLQDIMFEVVRSMILPQFEAKYHKMFSHVIPPKRWPFFGSSNTPPSPDWETRYCGDVALMMQDYPNAIKIYSKLFEKLKKTSKYLDAGSSKEFMTLACLVTEPAKKDFVKNMELAGQYYEQGNELGLVVRNIIFTYDILKLTGKYAEANCSLDRNYYSVQSEAEIPCLIVEQSAFSNIYSSPPLLRQFASHMFTAGKLYYYHGYLANSIFCLGLCYKIYQKANWTKQLIMR